MRITAQEKIESRARLLDAAKVLFRDRGFAEATIRDIAQAAGMAAGTVFNYFASKEELAVALAQETAAKAERDFGKKRRPKAGLAEDLFLQAATQLRAWKPLRAFFQPVIDTALASALAVDGFEASRELRTRQLACVAQVLREHGVDPERGLMTVPIYWALYVGVLSFWTNDKSAKQENTLAMLDQAVSMYVAWIESGK